MPSLRDAIRAAVISRTTVDELLHPHQRKIGYRPLELAAQEFERHEQAISKAKTFDELHDVIRGVVAGIRGIGELAAYDFSSRIGMKLRLYPTLVYLHAGTRAGAQALGIRGGTCEMKQLPKALQGLTPDEAEDCLCIYAGVLMGSAKTHRGRGSTSHRC